MDKKEIIQSILNLPEEDLFWQFSLDLTEVELLVVTEENPIIKDLYLSADASLFKIQSEEVSGTYYNDGLQKMYKDVTISITDPNYTFTTLDIVNCFQDLLDNPKKIHEITISKIDE